MAKKSRRSSYVTYDDLFRTCRFPEKRRGKGVSIQGGDKPVIASRLRPDGHQPEGHSTETGPSKVSRSQGGLNASIMILIKSPAELDRMRHASGIVGKTLKKVKEFAGEGVTTKELDRFAESIIRKEGGKPAFKGYKGFPATLCVSIDDEVVHGIPSARRLKDGELISVDVGVFFDGFFGDAATSFGIGKMSPSAQKLMEITEKALLRGIDQARAGRNLSDISHSVQTWVEENSFSVVKAFVGHGIGASL
ncbi:MAG: type I methionyl aminopeptidase, partial [Anaerolineae bacterium]